MSIWHTYTYVKMYSSSMLKYFCDIAEKVLLPTLEHIKLFISFAINHLHDNQRRLTLWPYCL